MYLSKKQKKIKYFHDMKNYIVFHHSLKKKEKKKVKDLVTWGPRSFAMFKKLQFTYLKLFFQNQDQKSRWFLSSWEFCAADGFGTLVLAIDGYIVWCFGSYADIGK